MLNAPSFGVIYAVLVRLPRCRLIMVMLCVNTYPIGVRQSVKRGKKNYAFKP